MNGFPIVSGNHFNRIPWTTVEEGSVGSLTRTLLTSDTEIRIDFDTAERWVILVRDPEHAGFDRAVFDASRRTGAAGAAISSNGEDARSFLALGFTVADRHRPFLFYYIEHFCVSLPSCLVAILGIADTLTQRSPSLNDSKT